MPKLKTCSGNPAVEKGVKGFKKGMSGNEKGRPRGSRNKTTLMVQALFDGEAEAIARKVIDRALEKDDWPALKSCLDHLLPTLKTAPVTFQIPTVETQQDLVAAYNAILSAFSKGEIAADEARVVNELLDGQRRAIEAAELGERVAKLEAALEAKL